MTSITPAPILASAQLDFFGDHMRLPRRPYCTDDLSAGLRIRSLKSALTRRYIQANPPHLRVWALFDIDRPGAALAWEDADLPPPAWAATNRENGHAHLSWGLSAPVLVDGLHARRGPMRYLAAVEAAFRVRLQADPGYGGLITKNPINPFWKILKGPRDCYDLGYLAEHVDLSKHLPKRGAHVEQVGLGRNCELFDWTRRAAYRRVGRAKREGNYVFWQKEIYDLAMGRNGDFTTPLDHREVYHLGRSVSKWTWNHYTGSYGPGGGDVAPEVLAQVQSALGKLSGAARRASTEDKRASARLMKAAGKSTREIGLALGVDHSTVVRWCR